MRIFFLIAVSVFVGAACSDEAAPTFDYPLDDVLRFDHVQTKGTHNSYHVAPEDDSVAEWQYTHLALDRQLSEQGVRQFELDLYIEPFEQTFEVYHFPRIDEQTTCRRFVQCLRTMKDWSDDNPAHHPIVTMIELKDGFDPATAEAFFELFESELSSVWPDSRLITPDFVRGDAATLAEALADRGWPALGDVRGRALFFLLGPTEFRDFYAHDRTSLDGRLAFVTGPLGTPYAAITNIDNPNSDDIAVAVAAGMMIRTRVDGDGPVIDPARLEAALAGPAHFLTTDMPEVQLAAGTPSWCNPITAPAECTAEALEDPAFVD